MILYGKPIKEFQHKQPEQLYLREKLYNIQEDVDMIYSMFFKELVDDVKRNSIKDPVEYQKKSSPEAMNYYSICVPRKPLNILFGAITSSQLKSKDCKEASKIIPAPIFCGVFSSGSAHYFVKNNPDVPPFITISVNSDIFYRLVFSKDSDLSKTIPIKKLVRAKNEITEARIKATISHELTHWIDNAQYNIFELILGKAKTPEERSQKLLLGQKNVNMTYFEIQSFIHGIAQLKNTHATYWDTYTLEELFDMYPPLGSLAIQFYRNYGEDVLSIWIKHLVKRMNREGLLGDNMKNSIPIQYFIESEQFSSNRV